MIAAILWKLYHLLQMILFYSILQQPDDFCKRNLSEAIQNVQPPQCTKLGSNWGYTFEIIPFAANNIILQHFAATPSFFEKKKILIQFRIPNYLCIPPLEEIDTKLLKLYHLLQIIILCSILQQLDDFCKGQLSESIQNA